MPRAARPAIEVPITATPDKEIERYALQLGDASADKVIPAGQYAICERIRNNLIDVGRFKAGDLLVIERDRGGLIETTIMQVASSSGGQLKLVTPTRDAKSRREAIYPASADGGEVIRIVARVRGTYIEL